MNPIAIPTGKQIIEIECPYCKGTGRCDCELCQTADSDELKATCLECNGIGWLDIAPYVKTE